MKTIKLTGYSIKQVKQFLSEKGYDKSHLQIWKFFKTKATKGTHYYHDGKFTNMEIKDDGITFYLEFLKLEKTLKNKFGESNGNSISNN